MSQPQSSGVGVRDNLTTGRLKRKNINFGKWWLDAVQLRSNILSWSYNPEFSTGVQKSQHSINDFPRMQCSPSLTKVLQAIITGEKEPDVSALDQDQKTYLERLVRRSGADVVLSIAEELNEEEEEEKDSPQAKRLRLETILAEFNSGNDSNELKFELQSLLSTMRTQKLINSSKQKDILLKYLCV
jgi:hypothetical protein